MLKLKTYAFGIGELCSSDKPEFGCSCGKLIDLDHEFEYYFWNTKEWEKVKGHRCWVPMAGPDINNDLFTLPDFPEEAKDYVLHIYMAHRLRGFLLGPV